MFELRDISRIENAPEVTNLEIVNMCENCLGEDKTFHQFYEPVSVLFYSELIQYGLKINNDVIQDGKVCVNISSNIRAKLKYIYDRYKLNEIVEHHHITTWQMKFIKNKEKIPFCLLFKYWYTTGIIDMNKAIAEAKNLEENNPNN